MAPKLSYPGVYIQELPSPVKTIIGVGTSMTVFIGRAARGPTDDYSIIHSFMDFSRIYGGLSSEYNMSYAVWQYYQNGGTDAIIIRVVNTFHPPDSGDTTDHDTKSRATKSIFETTKPFTLEAANEGRWSSNIEITIDTSDLPKNPPIIAGTEDKTLFNLVVELVRYSNPKAKEKELKGRTVISREFFRNLSTRKDNKFSYVKTVLKEQSKFVRVNTIDESDETQPNNPTYENNDKKKPIPFGIAKGNDNNPDPNKTGNDGDLLQPLDYFDPNIPKQGLGLLSNVDIFNLLCIPSDNSENNEPIKPEIYTTALTLFCIPRRAMLIVDAPSDWTTPQEAANKVDNEFITRHENAAIWFPNLIGPDILDPDGKGREFVPCGAVAGIIARIDNNRGVWKTDAGIEATLFGFTDLTVNLNDAENGDLNVLGINCIRNFPGGYGTVLWGGRTLRGADNLTDQWKYLAVRRTALFIEESLYRGTKWVVFEPNDEKLWAQIRLNVGAFMHDLFRKGAFQGTDPTKAYLVKCDSDTTTQEDIDKGIVNILVGFAPLKPAEFVVIQIQQLTNQESLT